MNAKPAPMEVFISYAKSDEPLCLELERHLSLLRREGLITTWHKGQIGAGKDRGKEVGKRLSTASVIVLLLSADFVASDACYGTEMWQAVERHETGEACVIPVVLRPMDSWLNMPFGNLQALPSNGKPVVSWSDRDEAFADVAQGVRSVVQGRKLSPSNGPSSTLPSVWNIPYPRNPYFTGRDELLTRLADALKAGQATALSQPQAISGLGGIGKTQIAVEFAYKHRDAYQTVLWAQADARESLVSGYIAIAGLLNLPEKDEQDHNITVFAVKAWLRSHRGWLLILDNADDLIMVHEFVPSVFDGHILLTTRTQATGKLARRIEVDTMPQDIGALFLLRRTTLLVSNAKLTDAIAPDVAVAREICEELGGLPLALDQAGAYIEEIPCSLKDYLYLYRNHRIRILKARGQLVDDHPEPVATTWSLSFEKVEQQDPAAAELLRLCAFLHADAVPEEMITDGAEHLGPLLQPLASDPLLLNSAIGVLTTYSLVRRDVETKTLSVHRLVQAVLRDSMDEQTRQQWIERALQVVNKVFPDFSLTTLPKCERYLPHALECAALIDQEEIVLKETAEFICRIGSYLLNRIRYAEAESLFRRALSICEQRLGTDPLDMFRCLHYLAAVYYVQGEYAEAESLFKRAHTLCEQLVGSGHPGATLSLKGLADLYRAQGKYTEAEPVYKWVLDIHEQHWGTDHPNTASSLNDLAGLYQMQRKYSEAESLFRRGLEIHEQKLGADDITTGRSLNNLALLYSAQRKYAKAKPLYERAISICEQRLGSDHPNTATCLNSLANLYRAQRKYEKAEPLYKRALEIREQQLGSDHPDVADSLNCLANLYRAQRKYAEAVPLCECALVIREQRLGGDDPQVANSLNCLANLYRAQRKYTEAKPLYERALSIYERRLGTQYPTTRIIRRNLTSLLRKMGRKRKIGLKTGQKHDIGFMSIIRAFFLLLLRANDPSKANSLDTLANFYYKRGSYAKAEPLYRRVLRLREKKLGTDHPNTASSLDCLATLYCAQGRYVEAEPLYRQALSICEQKLGTDHPGTAQCLNNLALLYDLQGKYMEAEPLYVRALEISEQKLGTDHPNTVRTLTNLAYLYRLQGKYMEAEPLYERALSICEQKLGTDHLETAMILNSLALLRQDQGRYTEAELSSRRALAIREQKLVANHPDTASSLHNLAGICYTQEKYIEAEPLYRRALEIRERKLGADHPDTASTLNSLANLYCIQKWYAKAEPLYGRALTIREQKLGADHPDTASTLNNLAYLYFAQEDYTKAEPSYRQALEIRERKLGADHPDVANGLSNLAALYYNQGRNEEGELLFRRALTLCEQALGEMHPETARCLSLLAVVYSQQRPDEADILYKRAISIYEQTLGETHSRTQKLRQLHVLLLLKMEHEEEAAALEKQGQRPPEEY